MPTPSGRKRNTVAIYRDLGTTQTDAGQHVEDWQLFKTVKGFVRPLRGKELQYARQTVGEVTHLAHIPYVAGLRPSDRLESDGVVYNIGSLPDMNERTIEYAVYATEATDGPFQSGGFLLLEGQPPQGFLLLEQGGRLRLEAG